MHEQIDFGSRHIRVVHGRGDPAEYGEVVRIFAGQLDGDVWILGNRAGSRWGQVHRRALAVTQILWSTQFEAFRCALVSQNPPPLRRLSYRGTLRGFRD
jgi:hypothetical protein